MKFVCWPKNLPLKHSNNLDLNPDQDQKTNSGISINTFRIHQTGFIFFLCHWRISCSEQFLLILFFKYFFIVRVRARTDLRATASHPQNETFFFCDSTTVHWYSVFLFFFMSGYVIFGNLLNCAVARRGCAVPYPAAQSPVISVQPSSHQLSSRTEISPAVPSAQVAAIQYIKTSMS